MYYLSSSFSPKGGGEGKIRRAAFYPLGRCFSQLLQPTIRAGAAGILPNGKRSKSERKRYGLRFKMEEMVDGANNAMTAALFFFLLSALTGSRK